MQRDRATLRQPIDGGLFGLTSWEGEVGVANWTYPADPGAVQRALANRLRIRRVWSSFLQN